MKRVSIAFFIVALYMLIVNTTAMGQLLVEDFSYTPATNLNGQGGWTAHSGAGTNPQLITSGGLSYPGYLSSGIGNAASFTTNGEDNNKPYSSFPGGTASGSLYYSLMVKIDSAASVGDYFFHLYKTSTTFSARIFARRAANGNIRFGIGRSSTIGNISFSDSIYTRGTTYLLVVKYTVIAGATNDTVALWINPTIGAPEAAPTVLESSLDRVTTDIDTMYAVAVRQGTAANAAIGTVDGIRVATTWPQPSPPAEAIADHATSTMRVTVSNEGNIGFINAFPPAAPGRGFQFNPVTTAGQRLFEGSLIIALDSVQVSDAARNSASPEVFDADLRFKANLDSSQSSGNRRVIVTAFDDSVAETPFGVYVTQKTVSYDTAGLSSALLVQLDLMNSTATPYNSLTVGAYFDWDVTAAGTDRGSVIADSTNTIPGINNGNPFRFDMLEMHAGTSPNAWVGVVPLNRNRFQGRRVAIQSTEIYPPHMTNGDKYRYITDNRATNPNGDGGSAADHGQIFGIGPYSVPAGGTKRVGFAIVAGTSLQGFVDATRAAQRAWVQRLGNTLDTIFTVDVSDLQAGIPETFALSQNYPNPFNPTTTIRFDLPKESDVTLKVYNILGQEVATVVKGLQQAGFYSAEWSGKNQFGAQVATGVYFYRIEAKQADGGAPFTSLKKMLLLK